jgi:hypothetical protein
VVLSCPEEAELRAAAEVALQQVAEAALVQRVGISVGEGGSCSSMSRSKASATLTCARDPKPVAHQDSVDSLADQPPMTCKGSILEGGLHDHIPIVPPDEGQRVTVSKRLRVLGEAERRQSLNSKTQVAHHHSDLPLRRELEDSRKLERRRHSISDAVPGSHEESTAIASTFGDGLVPDCSGGAASTASSLTDRVPCGKFDSKVLAFKQKVFAKGLSVASRDSWHPDRSWLEGDPWAGCDDIAEEDAIEWFSDFFAQRDAGRRGTQAAVLAKAITSDQPCVSLKHRLKKLVLEPVTLLAEEADLLPLPETRPSAQACCKEGAGAGQSDRDLSRMSTASCCSRGGNAPGSAPSTPGRSTENATATLDVVAQAVPDWAAPSGTDKDVQFRALCAVDEVWLRLGQGDKQALLDLLKETRRHIITTQVQKMRSAGKEMSRGPPESSSSAVPKSVLAGGLLANGLELILLEEH